MFWIILFGLLGAVVSATIIRDDIKIKGAKFEWIYIVPSLFFIFVGLMVGFIASIEWPHILIFLHSCNTWSCGIN